MNSNDLNIQISVYKKLTLARKALQLALAELSHELADARVSRRIDFYLRQVTKAIEDTLDLTKLRS